jgi:arylsulfatase A-like enzyme
MIRRHGTAALFGIAGLVAGLACSEPRSAEAPPLDPGLLYALADYVSVAEIESLDPNLPAGEVVSVSAGALRQRVPSTVAFYFPLPAGSRLVARGTLRVEGGPGDAPKGWLAIETMADGGRRRAVLRRDLTGSPAIEVDAEVGLPDGALASIHLNAMSAAPPGAPRWVVEWTRLEVRRDPPAPAPAPAADLARRRASVLFVLFDTLRADYTEPYGAKAIRTPALVSLAAKGVTFEKATANAAWTLPSVASVFTGTYPSLHGITSRQAFREATVLSRELPTLAEVLAGEGYRSVAVLNNPMLHPAIGLTRGFDEVHEYHALREEMLSRAPRSPEAEADFVWSSYLEPTIAAPAGGPFFAYLHELDPHHPFHPPPPYDAMYGPPYEGDAERLRAPELPNRFQADPGVLSPAELEFLRGQYAGEVSFMDRYLARILERLDAAGRAGDTLVVFLSDHGEALGQHEKLSHGNLLYEEVLRVPLILSLPGVLPEGVRVEVDAQLVDLPVTVLDLLGIPAPAAMQGTSLLPWMLDPERKVDPRPIFAKTLFLGSFSLDSVRYGSFKLIRNHEDGARSRIELYDLAGDPQELRDLSARRPVVAGALRQMLERREELDRARKVDARLVDLAEIDSEVVGRLQALGYVE